MKKLLITTLMILILTACSSASNSPQVDYATSAGSLPTVTQLLVGTMKLNGTAQDVTAKQATELLPLWQVYSELLTSDTAAQEEIDGLVKQIQETMTDEQMQAIQDMDLTQRDVFALMQQNSGGTNRTSQSSSSSSQSNGAGFGPPDGGMPMGAPPDGGGVPGGANFQSQSSSGSNSTTTGSGQGQIRSGIPSTLIQALVEMLQSKVGS